MIRAFRFLSAAVFMVGALAITLAAVVVWLTIIVQAASSLGWVAGALAFGASVWLWTVYGDLVLLPWGWWRDYWSRMHRQLEAMVQGR